MVQKMFSYLGSKYDKILLTVESRWQVRYITGTYCSYINFFYYAFEILNNKRCGWGP